MKDPTPIKTAILSLHPRFSVSPDPDTAPIPREIPLDDLLAEIKDRLKLGQLLHPPVRMETGQRFAGMSLVMTDRIDPKAPQPKIRMTAQIHLPLDRQDAETDQIFVAYAVTAVAVGEFLALVEAERNIAMKEAVAKAQAKVAAEKAKDGDPEDAGKVTQFPTPAGPPAPKAE